MILYLEGIVHFGPQKNNLVFYLINQGVPAAAELIDVPNEVKGDEVTLSWSNHQTMEPTSHNTLCTKEP